MVSSIIVAAGSGKRMGNSVNKVFLDLAGEPVLFHSIRAFEQHSEVGEIILVLKEEEIEQFEQMAAGHGFDKVTRIVSGGAERMESVARGLAAVAGESEVVLIHDGARPLVTEALISDAIRYTREYGAACPAVLPKDTIKVIGEDSLIAGELSRQSLRAVQTPQGFLTGLFRSLMAEALRAGQVFTDDTSIFVQAGRPVYLYPGSYDNLKITTAEDLALCRLIRRQF